MRCINLDEVYSSLSPVQQKSLEKFNGFGRRLLDSAAKVGLGQVDLARSLGVGKSAVNHWAQDNAKPHKKHWPEIENLLGVSMNYLLHGIPDVRATRDKPNDLTLEEWMLRAIKAEERLELALQAIDDLRIRLDFRNPGPSSSATEKVILQRGLAEVAGAEAEPPSSPASLPKVSAAAESSGPSGPPAPHRKH